MNAAFSSSSFSIQAFSQNAFAFEVAVIQPQAPPYAVDLPLRKRRKKENDEAFLISTLL